MAFLGGIFGRKRKPDHQELAKLLPAFIRARTWAEAQRIVRQHPELLSDGAEVLLDQHIAAAHEQGKQDSARVLEERRTWLRQCQQTNAEAAPAESASTARPQRPAIPIPPEFLPDLRQAQEAEQRYLRTGDRAALDKAVVVWERILRHAAFIATPKRFQLAALDGCGEVFLRRYWAQGRVDDLNRALECWQQAVQYTPPGSPDLPGYLTNLGLGLRGRYARSGQLADLEEAICVFRQAVQGTPPHSPDLPAILNNLGAGLRDRYACGGQVADLEEAIHVSQQAVQRTPPDSSDLAMYLNNLGTELRDRYARTGQLADLEEAIRVHQQAVQHTPSDSPDLPMYFTNLGNGLRERHAHTGQLADLEEAIRVHQQAVQHTPPDSPELPGHLNNLGAGLRDRYARSGRLVDLEEAISLFQQAMQRTPSDSPDLPMYLTNVGTGLRERYARSGQLADLEEALHAFQQAVHRTPPDSPGLPMCLNNLGAGLSERYARSGQLADLEEALRIFQQAVQRTPTDSADLPGYLTDLGIGLSERYARSGQLADLEEAIRVFQQAVQHTPSDSPDLPGHLTNLGIGLSDRYTRTGQLADMEEAIRIHQRALQHTPSDSPDLPMYFTNLGNGLRERYARSGRLADLEEAIRVHQQAVQHTPSDSPDLPGHLNNLGNGLRERYTRSGRLEDLEQACAIFDQATAALDRTLLLSPVAYQLGQQERWANLYARAVAVHLQAGQPTHALTLAEGSKSRLLTALLGRTALPAPATVPLTLVEQERDLAGQLNALDAADLARHGMALSSTEEAARLQRLKQRQVLVNQLQAIWQEMEACGPLAQDYVALRRGDRPGWEDLAHLTADVGPETVLVSLFTTGETTLLFVLRAGMEAPRVVEVPLDGAGWRDLLRRFLREVRLYDSTDRRAETWPTALLPLLHKAAPCLDEVRWIVLAPHAGGHMLPWGALAMWAGWAGAPVTVPALVVLARALDRPAEERTGALVVGNPLSDLPYAEEEAQQVADGLGISPLLRQQATREAVLQQLEQAGLAHFATHAYFASGSPLDSGIVLADGVLTAREILERGLRAPEFLALSACQTGMAEALGGDEMAGLSQALVYAGARSLLVSLWAVNDPATAHLMAGFYRGWRERGLDKATALREAMEATHNARPAWAHTYYWGAFTLVGDWR